MLSGDMIAGYRDSSYLYYPMFQWVDWQTQRGEFPLWMPYDNTGFPLLADGTSSLLYPGKAIFWLRSFSFPARYGAYLALHVLIAAGGSYFLSKTTGAGRSGATLAAISYAFGGSVLFQVCNCVYLVSAAWLPWALMCVWRMSAVDAKIGWAVGGSVCCSMMILGGDPQMVYHVGLIAAVTVLVQTIYRRRRDRRWKAPGGSGLVLLVILTSFLSAVQVLPTMEWAGFSDRANFDVPMNLYDGNFDALTRLPDRPPVTDVYQFSQEPWTMLGLVFPHVLGMDAPVNTRWSAALPGAERIWVPSNYFGCLVFLLAMTGLSLRTKGTKQPHGPGRVWLSWIAVWFVIASFGWYGVGWLMQELAIRNVAQTDGTFSEPVGGIYWLMVIALPKYCLFRYPAKLMVIGCLAMSVLAGLNLNPRGILKLFRLCFATSVISTLGIVILFLPWTTDFLKSCQTTTVFGPFVWDESWRVIVLGFLSTLFCCIVAMAAMVKCKNGAQFKWLCGGLVVLVAVDLTWNNRWMLHPIDARVMTQTTDTERRIENFQANQTDHSLEVSVLGTNFDNERFFETSSPNRVAELATWRREALFPKTHLLIDGVRVWGSFTSIWPMAFDQINPQTIAADAWVECDGDKVVLKLPLEAVLKVPSDVPSDVPEKPKTNAWADPVEVLGWKGQTFEARLNQKRDTGIPYEIVLPILPVPGWQATFSANNSGGSNDGFGNTGDAEIVMIKAAELSAWGPLHSSATVPESFWGKSWGLRCVYRPASFTWGLIVSGISWLGVAGWVLRIFYRRRFG